MGRGFRQLTLERLDTMDSLTFRWQGYIYEWWERGLGEREAHREIMVRMLYLLSELEKATSDFRDII